MDGLSGISSGIYRTIQYSTPYERYVLASSKGVVQSPQGVIINLQDSEVPNKILLDIYRGTYEKNELLAIEQYLTHEMDIVELGACLGFISCFSNKKKNQKRNHVVVEPNERMIPILQRNRDLNDCDFEIINRAYSTEEGQIEFQLSMNPLSSGTHRKGINKVSVPTISLADIISNYDLSNIALIVDIEGAECELIEQELDLLEEVASLLIIEFHEKKIESDELASRLKKAHRALDQSKFECIQENSNVEVYRI